MKQFSRPALICVSVVLSACSAMQSGNNFPLPSDAQIAACDEAIINKPQMFHYIDMGDGNYLRCSDLSIRRSKDNMLSRTTY